MNKYGGIFFSAKTRWKVNNNNGVYIYKNDLNNVGEYIKIEI